MEWDRKHVGEVLQAARLAQGLSLNEVYRRTGIKSQTISKIEKGGHYRAPTRGTQVKLEAALGIKLPIPRDSPIKVDIYVSPGQVCYIKEAVSAFPGESQSQAIMNALKAWSEHRALLAKWYADHDVDVKKEVEKMVVKLHSRLERQRKREEKGE